MKNLALKGDKEAKRNRGQLETISKRVFLIDASRKTN